MGTELQSVSTFLESILLALEMGLVGDHNFHGARSRSRMHSPWLLRSAPRELNETNILHTEGIQSPGPMTPLVGGSRGAPFGEGTLSPLRRYLKPLPKGGRGGRGGERGTEAPLKVP